MPGGEGMVGCEGDMLTVSLCQGLISLVYMPSHLTCHFLERIIWNRDTKALPKTRLYVLYAAPLTCHLLERINWNKDTQKYILYKKQQQTFEGLTNSCNFDATKYQGSYQSQHWGEVPWYNTVDKSHNWGQVPWHHKVKHLQGSLVGFNGRSPMIKTGLPWRPEVKVICSASYWSAP